MQERGEFDNRSGKGKSIDLAEYFEMPEDIRVAQSMLKNAGMTSREVNLLKGIAGLRNILAMAVDKKKKQEIQKQIQDRQIEVSLMMEWQKRQRREK